MCGGDDLREAGEVGESLGRYKPKLEKGLAARTR
jgi:hypothetical protein